MRAVLRYAPVYDGYELWLYEQHPDGRHVYTVEGGALRLQPRVSDGVEVAPTLTLRTEALEALVEVAREESEPVLVGELADARAVRDRLFSLVETLSGGLS